MVIHYKNFIFSPTVVAGFTVAFLVYSGIIGVANRHTFRAIIPAKNIIALEGHMVSNATKTSSGNYYSAQLDVFSVRSKNVTSEASGMVQVLLPTDIVEALYPDKLYSSVYSSHLIQSPVFEQGLVFTSLGYLISQTDQEKTSYPLFVVNSIIDYKWKNNLSRIRALFRLEFKRLLFAWGDAGGLLLALLSGSREYTNVNLANGFKNAGLSHILALSGMHLSLFAGIALTIGSVAGKKLATVLSLVAVIIFVWFAGLSPSLFRALTCTLISLLLQFCSLPGVSGNSEVVYRFISPSFTSIRLIRIISLSFLVHAILYPNDLFSAAFMLSYGALIGIALAEYLVKPLLARFLTPMLASPFSAAIGAQICTAPITVSLFGTLMPIGIISSVVVSPLVIVFLVVGFFCILLSFCIPFLLYQFNDIIQIMYWILERIVLWFSQFPPVHFL